MMYEFAGLIITISLLLVALVINSKDLVEYDEYEDINKYIDEIELREQLLKED